MIGWNRHFGPGGQYPGASTTSSARWSPGEKDSLLLMGAK